MHDMLKGQLLNLLGIVQTALDLNVFYQDAIIFCWSFLMGELSLSQPSLPLRINSNGIKLAEMDSEFNVN